MRIEEAPGQRHVDPAVGRQSCVRARSVTGLADAALELHATTLLDDVRGPNGEVFGDT